jgi:PAS domain S-box-containing protein
MKPTDMSSLHWFLKGRNLALVCMVLFLCLGAGVFLLCLDRYRSTVNLSLKEDRATANLLSLILEEHLSKLVKTMEAYANRPLLIQAVKKKDVSRAMEHLVSLTTNNPGIDSAIITDKAANVWASYPLRPELIGMNLTHREWYQGVSREWKPYISDGAIRLVAEKDIGFQVAVPIFNERGEVIGILVHTQRAVFLSRIIQRILLDLGNFSNVTDRKGNLIYSSRFAYSKELKPYPFFFVREQVKTAKAQSVPVADPFLGGRTRYISYAPVEGVGWSVFICRDSRAILQGESRYFIQTAVIALLIFLSVTLALVYLRKQVLMKQYLARTQAERELNRSEERFRATFEQAAVGIALVGIDGRWLRVNRRLCAITGYPAEEFLTRTFQDITYPDDLDRDLDLVRQLLAGEIPDYSMEKRYLTRDGAVIWANLTVGLVRDEQGAPDYFISVIEDIFLRKRAEEELRTAHDNLEQNQSRLVEAQHVARLGSWEWDATTDAITGSEEFYRLFGVTPDRIVHFDQFIDLLHPDDRELVRQDVAEALRRERPYETDYRVLLPDGGYRHIGARARILSDDQGAPRRMIGTCLDITKRMEAEEKLRTLNEDLTRSNQELEQFAYIASHDLQEPLRMVSSYTQLLASRYGEHLDQDARDFIGFAVDGANRMQRLIQDLLAYSRVTTRGKPPEPLDSYDALGEAVANLQAAIQENGALVTYGDLPRVMGDRGQLVLVFQNLIANAVKFHLPEKLPCINVSAECTGTYWTFRVADNGIGIEPKYFDQVFQVFKRLHTRSEYAGTGIGLAICKRTIERHGGRIWVESEPGKGSTFFFTLPAAPDTKGEGE